MSLENFQPGDLVRLKSGGPVMTVHHADSAGDVVCNWFEKGQPKGNVWPQALLERVENREVGISERWTPDID